MLAPEGPPDNIPALQRRLCRQRGTSPVGTADVFRATASFAKKTHSLAIHFLVAPGSGVGPIISRSRRERFAASER
jgi:hypothetical protein